MPDNKLNRRQIIQSALALVPGAGLNWDMLPVAKSTPSRSDQFDAVIVGAGLGGLSCGFAFARQGFKVLILEKHDKPGGYATTFRRPGGFVFDVSLHSITVGERDGIRDRRHSQALAGDGQDRNEPVPGGVSAPRAILRPDLGHHDGRAHQGHPAEGHRLGAVGPSARGAWNTRSASRNWSSTPTVPS